MALVALKFSVHLPEIKTKSGTNLQNITNTDYSCTQPNVFQLSAALPDMMMISLWLYVESSGNWKARRQRHHSTRARRVGGFGEDSASHCNLYIQPEARESSSSMILRGNREAAQYELAQISTLEFTTSSTPNWHGLGRGRV